MFGVFQVKRSDGVIRTKLIGARLWGFILAVNGMHPKCWRPLPEKADEEAEEPRQKDESAENAQDAQHVER
jgi:hypothetical protein